MTVQEDWRYCIRCRGLFFGPNSQGYCPAVSGPHPIDRGIYVLINDTAQAEGQREWFWCSQCYLLFYGGGGRRAGVCPAAFGHHDGTRSANYTLFSEDPNNFGQPGWRWCSKCDGLFYIQLPPSVCPAGGEHDGSRSEKYLLMHYRQR
jgi:hypothetical protein